jgi:putative ABC transport system permease protein
MSGDPIPQKSSQLFVPQIDNWGPDSHTKDNEPADQLSYPDVEQLLRQHLAKRQTAMYGVGFAVIPQDASQSAFQADGRAVFADFFAMFEVPFRYGAPWTAADDENRADVVVIGQKLNDRLFAGANSVGKTINLGNHEYRIAGVLDHWQPVPRFYDVISGSSFSETEDVFLPFTRAIDSKMQQHGNNSCNSLPGPGWEGHLQSDCVWLQFWVELPTAADAQRYRSFLDRYAEDQQHSGRFHWPPNNRLRNVREWLDAEHVVSNEANIMVVVSFSFLIVCLINAIGLMLAKFMGRAGEIGVRRALGASRRAIFSQCLVETAIIGLAGGVLGLGVTALGLVGLRAVLTEEIERLAHLDVAGIAIAIAVALVATVIAGLYPTWRAALVQPAWQLKAN